MTQIRMTEFSHGAGCGCKLSPEVLAEILEGQTELASPDLLVGNAGRDDAAVFKLNEEIALVSTTDFFMPIVDSAFDFGRIASANAISDVYAMGGTPQMAISIFGWPLDKIPLEAAREVIAGSREICARAGITLAGGHSIDCPEPIFGLAVTGTVAVKNIKTNAGAQVGDRLFLTKPLGVGVLTTAQKKGILRPEHADLARDIMIQLNDLGKDLADLEYVHALTDVTGFGFLGHLVEMCEASGVSATIEVDRVPQIDIVQDYIGQGALPGGTKRNWQSYGSKIAPQLHSYKNILADPQTSGGLLVSLAAEAEQEFKQLCLRRSIDFEFFGSITEQEKYVVKSV